MSKGEPRRDVLFNLPVPTRNVLNEPGFSEIPFVLMTHVMLVVAVTFPASRVFFMSYRVDVLPRGKNGPGGPHVHESTDEIEL